MEDNKVYAIGYNKFGITWFGTRIEMSINIQLFQNYIIRISKEFYVGNHCVFARNNKNQIYSWGCNYTGQLARKCGYYECSRPMKVEFFENLNIIQISCGFSDRLGLTQEGELYGWGWSGYGQTGSRSEELTPIRVKLHVSSDRIKFIHCCVFTSCAVTVDGRAYLWGYINGRKYSYSTTH